ncbi:helix-turn-helix transcriptional regulator [Amycolatopsis sp. CA-128772]|uniref:helix-turn-helix domain-containing protein n=1 Tax=Amycolatopsis sp. CA-128772 TaxID=2073159 RepID=UPI001305039E|nr:helix-turn-helix transcriptional regulator [Amycolatopsis sp. CA-128772]
MTTEITVVPETLSAAQSDMNIRNSGPGADRVRWIEFHRYNAEMFRLAGERLAELGHAAEDDWTGWCFTLQTEAVSRHVRLLRMDLARLQGDLGNQTDAVLGVDDIPAPSQHGFGHWLRDTCLSAGMSVEALAERAGVPLSLLERVWQGREPMRSLEQVAAVADTMGIDGAVAAVVAMRDFQRGRDARRNPVPR